MNALLRWRSLSWPDRLLLCEAMLFLTVASAAIVFLPFRWVAKFAQWGSGDASFTAETRHDIARRTRWALQACARRVPWTAKCFQQGLAAQFMLRRRGVPSVLYYGAAPDTQRGLIAHVWVRDENTDVIGCEDAPHFAVLATFPSIQAK